MKSPRLSSTSHTIDVKFDTSNALRTMFESPSFLIHDPKVSYQQIATDLKKFPEYKGEENIVSWQYCHNINDAVRDSDAIVLATEWQEYTELNWGDISKLMNRPGWVFDTRQILNGNEIKNNGLNYWCLGEGDENIEV